MADSLAHRGPDASGLWQEDSVCLGHRRLSILDLSTAANQPFHSQDQDDVMVYNGEIYNFRELAHELDLSCRTQSDTEVLLEGFVRLGTSLFGRLRGMFSLAIYRRSSRQLWLCRDRLGIKPLYYAWHQGRFVFASELKAFRALGGKFPLTLNPLALTQYLHCGYVPTPQSAYLEVHKFPAGQWCEVRPSGLHFSTYWDLSEQIEPQVFDDEELALQELRTRVERSVGYRLVSDVPFGVFLSGGIDSSLVAAVAQKLSPSPLNTFSIGVPDPRHNEAPYARKVAQALGTRHHEFELSESEAQRLLVQTSAVYDEPFADSSAAPTMFVSQLARDQVAMVLTGDGGDETFLGYGAYPWARRLAHPWLWRWRKVLSWLLGLGSSRYRRVAQLLDVPRVEEVRSHLFSQEQGMFTGQEIRRLWQGPTTSDSYNLPFTESLSPRRLQPDEQQALYDLRYYLQDDLLVKVDRASMRYGLEARVPLLDHDIVQFALNLSPRLRRGKGLLRKLLFTYLPAQLFDRPKRGFSIPLDRWLTGGLAEMEASYLNIDIVRRFGLVHSDEVEKLRRRFHQGERRLATRLWVLIVMHQWLDLQSR